MSKKKAMPKAYSVKGKISPITALLFVLLIIYIIVLVVPVIWSIIVSFGDRIDYDLFKQIPSGKYWPKFTFNNYIDAWKNVSIKTVPSVKNPTERVYNVMGLFSNSLLYALGCALMQTIFPCIVGYAAARFKFKFSKIIYAFVLVTMALPIVGSMSSEIRMLTALGINESFFGMWVLKAHFLTLYFLIFYAQFQSIPMDYTEAARVDGASNLRIMMRVILPQAFGTILTVFILNFITYWNDYQVPLVYLPNYPTVAYSIYYFINVPSGGNITSYMPVKMAATIIMTLPIVIVFIVFNRRLRVGVSMGGIKG